MTQTRTLYFEDVLEGMALPVLVRRPDIVTSMRVCAASENFHRIHWDREFALKDGLPDVILGTNYLGNLLAQLVTDWIGPEGTLRKLAYRFRGPAHPGDTLTVTGVVKAKEARPEGGWVDLDLWIAKGERRITEGSGVVLLPRRTAASVA